MRYVRLACIELGLACLGTGLYFLIGPSRQAEREERAVLSIEEKESAPFPDNSAAADRAERRQPLGLMLVLGGFILLFLGFAVHMGMAYSALHTHPGPGVLVRPGKAHEPPPES